MPDQIIGALDDAFGQPKDEIAYLRSIDNTLKQILKSCGGSSQSNARNSSSNQSQSDRSNSWNSGPNFRRNRYGSFANGFEEAIKEALFGSDYKKKIGKAVSDFAKQFGLDLNDLEGQLGKKLGDMAMGTFKSTKFGQNMFKGFNQAGDIFMKGMKSAAGKFMEAETLGEGVEAAGVAVKAGAGAAGKALSAIHPAILAATVAFIALDAASGPAIKGLKSLADASKTAFFRTQKSSEENIKLAKKRLTEDVNSLITEPFNILKDAAQALYNAWDSSIRTINQTQGYDKAGLQDLISVYAARLRESNLSSVVSSADIVTALTKVLESGLSGAIAEEFAYQATILNSAVPTEDFFGYSSAYGSLVAQQMRAGKSQTDALSYATEQLKEFASGILYANRVLTGGAFTSTYGSSVFESAVKITQAAQAGDASLIGRTLESISAVTGTYAPDLAQSIMDAVVSAALGGNSSSLVALRAMASTGASNTSFLQALVRNPKQVYSEIFANLGQLQNMAPSAFMEVAEGLSSIFGISTDAFARVDFGALSTAIISIADDSRSLDENMTLLASGQSTTSKEMLRMQQVNEYMIDEGLSYVLDNEVARSIQQHMWDEQLARELMEAEYGVELRGAALELLEGLSQTVDNLLTILNPFAWANKIADLFLTSAEGAAQESDISQALQLGSVGTNLSALYQLTSRDKDLNLTKSYIELLGGTSFYETVANKRKAMDWENGNFSFTAWRSLVDSGVQDILALTDAANAANAPTSRYGWGGISKSGAGLLRGSGPYSFTPRTVSGVATGAVASQSNFQRMLEAAKDYNTYTEWYSDASKFGVSDVIAAAQEAGMSENQLKNYFQQRAVGRYQESQAAAKEAEEKWKSDMLGASNSASQDLTHIYEAIINNSDPGIYYYLSGIHELVAKIAERILMPLYGSGETAESYTTKLRQIEDEQKQDAIESRERLADALIAGLGNLEDPANQTNVLLSYILKAVISIGQRDASGVFTTLADTLSGLSMGLQTKV